MVGNIKTLAATAFLILAAGGSAMAQAGHHSPNGLTLTSPAFDSGEAIPLRYSAYGDNVSPELNWSHAPSGTRSFALVLEDMDASTPEPFVHWVVYNIPASMNGLPETSSPTRPVLEADASIDVAVQGPTDIPETLEEFERVGYFGPRPPLGRAHSYRFTLYALSSEPTLPAGLAASELREAIESDVLAEARLIGTFEASQ